MPTVRVRYFAGARAASGVEEESIELPAGATVHDVVARLGARHGATLSRVLKSSSFLLNGIAVRNKDVTLDDDMGLDVLPPFAGG